MSDIVVTVPMKLWEEWIGEGDLPGEPPTGNRSHFWIGGQMPTISPGQRVYVVAYGRLRGYAPLVEVEARCSLDPGRACLLRDGNAQAVTIAQPIKGFRGWRYRWWDRREEKPFPDWMIL